MQMWSPLTLKLRRAAYAPNTKHTARRSKTTGVRATMTTASTSETHTSSEKPTKPRCSHPGCKEDGTKKKPGSNSDDWLCPKHKLEEDYKRFKDIAKSSKSSSEREAAQKNAQKTKAKLDALGMPEDPPDFKQWVAEAKDLVKNRDRDAWRLAELAAKVDGKYGEGKVSLFAHQIGVAYKTVKNWRATAKAWPQEAGRPALSIAERLNEHPDRYEIAKGNISFRDACRIMADYRRGEEAKAGAKTEGAGHGGGHGGGHGAGHGGGHSKSNGAATESEQQADYQSLVRNLKDRVDEDRGHLPKSQIIKALNAVINDVNMWAK
jgi:hypothetical protein